MRVIIDRFETDYAVVELEDGSFLQLPSKLFPGAVEGDVVVIKVDKQETEKRKKLIWDLRRRMDK